MSQASAHLAQSAQHYDLAEFSNGVEDCKNGNPHSMGKSDDYSAGYAAMYEIQEAISCEKFN
jgi:hypothetical protein